MKGVARLATELALSPMTARVRRGMEYPSRAGDDRETREQARWVLETAGANKTPKKMAKFVKVFSGPRRLGRDRFGGQIGANGHLRRA